MSMLQDIGEKDFEERVLRAEIPTLVDFWAPWCAPCRMMTPVLESLSRKLAGRVAVLKLNTDENFDLVRKFGVMAIPTLVLFREGKEARRLTGFIPETDLETEILKALSPDGKP